MADHGVKERVARAVEKLVAKAKANIGSVSPSGKTNRPKSPNKVVLPPLPMPVSPHTSVYRLASRNGAVFRTAMSRTS